MGFFTGSFRLEEYGCGLTTQRLHNDENWNDDVISWIDIEELCDGYVSNVGSVATIHISPGYTENDVDLVEKMFGLYPQYGISAVLIVPFDGWKKESENRRI